jgi:hypothetical protein
MAQITLNSTGVASNGSLVLQSNGTTTAVTIDASQRAAFVAGTAALPAITTTGDTNTGIWFPAADTIAFSEGGAEAMRIDSSGNLGIGTSPSYRIHVANSSATSTTLLANVLARLQSNASGADVSLQFSDNVTNSAGISLNQGSLVTSIAGGEVMRVNTSGNVGIGTSSPNSATRLQVANANIASLATQANMMVTTTDAQGANVGGVIGLGGSVTTASPSANMRLFGAIKGAKDDSTDGNTNGYMSFFTMGSGTVTPTERMRIDSSGNLLVGKTAADATTAGSAILPAYGGANIPAMTLAGASSSNSQLGYHQYSTSAAAFRFYVGYGGTVYATSTTITGISDQRLKENIRDLDDGLEKVLLLKPRKFDWKEGKGADIKDARGFIAQEFEIVFPDMVEEWKDPAPEGEEPYKAVNANLIPTLVKAIQELKALVDTQASTIQSLTTRITALESI